MHATPLLVQLKSARLPMPEVEYRFAPPRRWRFDFAWVDQRLAVEIDGGAFLATGSRHTRGAGFRRDCQKFNEATCRGWRVLRLLPEDVTSGAGLTWIERALKGVTP
jgi:very-short-patch-repair endonuclease